MSLPHATALLNSTPALAGRQSERAALLAQFRGAIGGQCRVALVAGEPGIGKTRLLQEVAKRVAADGATVLRGGGGEADGMPPYLPFLEALGTYIAGADSDALRGQAGPVAATLGAVFPELVSRLGPLTAGYALPPDQARLRFYQAVGTFLAAIAAPHGLALLLDDLQWTDAASLDLLCHLTSHQLSAPLFILGAYRDGEAAANPTLQRAIAELSRQRVTTLMTLAPLPRREVALLAESYLGAQVHAEISRLLHAHGEGNPFFSEELLRGWVETGSVVKGPAGWALTSSISVERALPSSVTAAVGQRLARLTPETHDLLCVAAIVGRTFSSDVVAMVSDLDTEIVEERLRAAVAARLIQGESAGAWGAVYTFSHDKIRECLYSDVGSTRRARLHAAIGAALEGRGIGEPGRRLADLAFHFVRGGSAEQAITYSCRAADAALAAYAPDEALAQYRVALTLLAAPDARRGPVLLGLGEAALRAGQELEAVAAYQAARRLFQQAGDAAATARAVHGLGRAQGSLEALPAAREALEAAAALLGDAPGAAAVGVLVDLATLLGSSMGDHGTGLMHARRALDMARRLANSRLEAMASRTVGNLLVRGNAITAGMELLERALALATADDDPVEAAECCACLASACYFTTDVERSRAFTEQRLEHARRSHQPFQLRHVSSWLALIAAQTGGRDAEDLITQAQNVVEGINSPEPGAFLHQVRGFLLFQRGEYAAARDELQRAIAVFRPAGPAVLAWYLGLLGLAAAEAGAMGTARTCLDELEDILAALPRDQEELPRAPALACGALLALALGEHARLPLLYDQLARFSGQLHWFLMDWALGKVATARGAWAEAEAHLAAAETSARRHGLWPDMGRTLVAWSDLSVARGGPRRDEALREALVIFQSAGMAGEARRTTLLLEGAGRGQTARPAAPHGLTERELAVLRLVVAGQTNRAIAHQLALSEKTVANHLTNIFNKISVDNRAGATAFAVRHGLA